LELPYEFRKYLIENPKILIYLAVVVIVVIVYYYIKEKKEMRENIKYTFAKGERIQKIKDIERHHKKELKKYEFAIIIYVLFLLWAFYLLSGK
jgi:hypothetical protein